MVLKYVLFESASGFALFERLSSEEIGEQLEEMQRAIGDFSNFSKMLKLKGFAPFTSAESSLECINDVSEGLLSETLKVFLDNQGIASGKSKKKGGFSMGVVDPRLAGSIKEATQIDCECNEAVIELCRGIRQHLDKFLRGLEHGDIEKAQVGLAHSFSRSKVKFNVNRADNMIIQSICILDQIDKDINTFAMRVREWYSWHFPELGKIVSDMKTYVPIAHFIQSKKSLLDEEKRAGLVSICDGDEDLAKKIVEAARASIGADLSEFDMLNINTFSLRVLNLMQYRKDLFDYLHDRMNAVAPNLTALIGEQVGARLIAKAGSLTNLAKAPASTVQILGAEKALFRALKTKGNTPKYGLIYHSTFIGRAAAKNKGRVSRFLANKCSMASRIDCFTEEPGDAFGKAFRDQVEERLEFYSSGKVPRKNLDVVHEAMANSTPAANGDTKKSKKRKSKDDDDSTEKDKKKKSKKSKSDEPAEPEPEAADDDDKPAKKKKKKSKD